MSSLKLGADLYILIYDCMRSDDAIGTNTGFTSVVGNWNSDDAMVGNNRIVNDLD